MFALESLSLAGEVYDNSASVRKACEFLVKHQMHDGGWGETYMVRERNLPSIMLLKRFRSCSRA
jgi:lanosterol synthase